MDIWDSKCVRDILWPQDNIEFQDIYIGKGMVNDY